MCDTLLQWPEKADVAARMSYGSDSKGCNLREENSHRKPPNGGGGRELEGGGDRELEEREAGLRTLSRRQTRNRAS